MIAEATHADDTDTVDREIARVDSDESPGMGPRERISRILASGDPQRAVLSSVVDRAADELRRTQLGTDRLEACVRHADAMDVKDQPATDFLGEALTQASPLARETWSPQGQASGENARLHTHVWYPHTLDLPAIDGAQVHRVDARGLDRPAFVDVVARLDMSDTVDLGHLALFSAEADTGTEAASSDSGEFL